MYSMHCFSIQHNLHANSLPFDLALQGAPLNDQWETQQGAVTVRHPYSHTAGPLSATNCLQLIYMQKRARKRRLNQYGKEYELVSVEAWFTLINMR